MKMKIYIPLLFVLLFNVQYALSSTSKEDIKQLLESDTELTTLYAVTYDKLISRMDQYGYLPESLTGAYKGMYPRTIGAYALLMIETERYHEAELVLKYVLDAMEDNEEIFVPHVVGNEGNDVGGNGSILDDQYQSDAHAHMILGWARLALKRGVTSFEDDTWQQVKALMNRVCDRTLFLHGDWSIEPNLVRAVTFEHSRDGRMWDAFDLLTQSFVGAALEEMIKVANKRGDTKHEVKWREKMNLLKQGIEENLVVERDGTKTYAEMFIPNGNGGDAYMGMGWVCFSPIAAGWQGADESVLRNTMAYMEKHYLQTANGIKWMPTDIYPDGVFVNEVIGKGIGWELDYARSEGNYDRVYEILQLIKASSVGKPIYMEFAWLEGNGYTRNSKITKNIVDNEMQNSVWTSRDAGNGEQNTWFCWAMARLRKSLGMAAEPDKVVSPENIISTSNKNGLGKRIANIHSSNGWDNNTENTYNLLLDKYDVTSRSDKWFSTNSENPWVIFSLADIYSIEKVEFRDGRWYETEEGVTNTDEYAVFVSTTGVEDGDWTEIKRETGVRSQNVKSFTLDTPVDARYVKMTFKGGGNTNKKLWIYGVDIYGTFSKKIDRGDLISVGKSVSAVGHHYSNRETPVNLLDGLMDNHWAVNKSEQKTWVIIDLEDEYDINKFVVVDGEDWITGYNISVSSELLPKNSDAWSLVVDNASFDKTQQRKESVLSSPVTGRYVKLEVPNDKQSGWTRIKEFEIYGTVSKD